MNIHEEFAVWINPYPGSSGHVVRTFRTEQEAAEFAGKHSGIKKHGGRIERTLTTRSVVLLFEATANKTYFPHVNRRL